MKKTFWLTLLSWFVLSLFIVVKVDIPYTFYEVQTAYSAYSHFSIFNLRSLPILIFGLNPIGVRLVGIVLGLICIYLFSKLGNKLALILFSFSPLFIKVAVLAVDKMILLLVFLVVANIFLNVKRSVKWKLILAGVAVVLGLMFLDLRTLASSLVFQKYNPKNYTYIIDQRLSFGMLHGSPLIIGDNNFNRISLNKVYYGANEVFKSFIAPFNFELLMSPFQSQTILSKEALNRGLHAFYFWEPLVLIIYFIFVKQKKRQNIKLLVAGVVILFLFGIEYVVFLLPSIVLLQSEVLTRVNRKYFVFLALLYLASLGVFLDIFFNRKSEWVKNEDYKQFEIWRSITAEDINSKKIIVTDRFGEPAYYYLVYKMVDPKYFESNKVLGRYLESGSQRVEKIDNIEFRSFDFKRETKKSGEVWVGSGVDFGEKNNELQITRI